MRVSVLRPCDLCRSPVAGNSRGGPALDFRRIVIERQLLDMGAIREHAGLSMLLGGSERLALAMGSDREATGLLSSWELFVCSACWTDLAETALCRALAEGKGREIPVPEVRS